MALLVQSRNRNRVKMQVPVDADTEHGDSLAESRGI